MNRDVLVRVIVGVVIVVLAIQNWMQSGQLDLGISKSFSVAVLVATFVLALWETWLWRLPLAQKITGSHRCIRGTWRGVRRSLWVDPQTGEQAPPKTVYLTVRQSASYVTIRFYSDESTSTSSFATLRMTDGMCELLYMYMNIPGPRHEFRIHMHHGSVWLNLSGNPVRRITGRYWTDRDTKGELDFTERVTDIADDFDTATRLFN